MKQNVHVYKMWLILQNNKSSCLSQSYHRYALNYINALNYLETLRRHNDFCEFEKVGMWRVIPTTLRNGSHVTAVETFLCN